LFHQQALPLEYREERFLTPSISSPFAHSSSGCKGHEAFISVTPGNTSSVRTLWSADAMTEALMVFRGIFFGIVLSLMMWVMAWALIANIV
jgi:hypothetical protein